MFKRENLKSLLLVVLVLTPAGYYLINIGMGQLAVANRQAQMPDALVFATGGPVPTALVHDVQAGHFVEHVVKGKTAVDKDFFKGQWTLLMLGVDNASGKSVHRKASQQARYMIKARELMPELRLMGAQVKRQLSGFSFGTNAFFKKCHRQSGCVDNYLFIGKTGWFGGSEIHFTPAKEWINSVRASLKMTAPLMQLPWVVLVNPNGEIVVPIDKDGLSQNYHPEILIPALKTYITEGV